mgnify:FL=1
MVPYYVSPIYTFIEAQLCPAPRLLSDASRAFCTVLKYSQKDALSVGHMELEEFGAGCDQSYTDQNYRLLKKGDQLSLFLFLASIKGDNDLPRKSL